MNTEVDPRTPTGPGDGGPPSSGTGGARRKRVLAGALALTLGLGVVAGALWWVLGRPSVRFTAGPNQPVNQDAMVSAHNSPTIAVSPTDPRFLAVAGRIDRPNYSASVNVSRDGGQTWSESRLNLPPGQSRPFEPQTAFDGQGVLIVLFSTLEARGLIPNGLWLERSEDGGRTFSPPVKVADRFTYQPRLVVSHTSGNVHVTWLQASEAVVAEVAASLNQPTSAKPAPGLGPPPNPIVMATSRDGGASFPERAPVSDPSRQHVGAASPAIAPNGDLYVLYQDYGADVTDFRGLPGGVYRGAFSLVVSRSTNTGSSFSTAGVAESAAVPFERFLVFLPKFPSLAVDPRNGTLYVAWSDNRNGDADVFVRHSDDGGKTWSRLVRVDNHEDEPRHQQYLPKIGVAPNGRVDVLFLNGNDRSERLLTLAVLASSVDGGRTWEAIAVSSEAFDARIGPQNEPRDADARAEADIGTTLGLVSTNAAAYTVWADSRRGTTETGDQDLFFARVRITRE